MKLLILAGQFQKYHAISMLLYLWPIHTDNIQIKLYDLQISPSSSGCLFQVVKLDLSTISELSHEYFTEVSVLACLN